MLILLILRFYIGAYTNVNKLFVVFNKIILVVVLKNTEFRVA